MKERKKILKVITGSRLYGTNRPESDTDYLGVFLPSEEDMFSLLNPPREWNEDEKNSDGPRNTKDDVDYKSFALQRFFRLAGEGQPGQLELLFAPEDKIVSKTEEWDEILTSRNLFLSQKSIKPFIGFALSQAHKSVIKGENLNTIKALIKYLGEMTDAQLNEPLRVRLDCGPMVIDSVGIHNIGGIEVTRMINEFGADVVKIANRQYDVGRKTKDFLNSLKELEGRYGTRTRASAELGVDPKFLMHAYRQLNQATELLQTGFITLPRPAHEIEVYRAIRENTYIPKNHADFFDEMTAMIDHIRQVVEPASPLPKEVDWRKIIKLCQFMLRKHLL